MHVEIERIYRVAVVQDDGACDIAETFDTSQGAALRAVQWADGRCEIVSKDDTKPSTGDVCPTCDQVQGYGQALEDLVLDYLQALQDDSADRDALVFEALERLERAVE